MTRASKQQRFIQVQKEVKKFGYFYTETKLTDLEVERYARNGAKMHTVWGLSKRLEKIAKVPKVIPFFMDYISPIPRIADNDPNIATVYERMKSFVADKNIVILTSSLPK